MRRQDLFLVTAKGSMEVIVLVAGNPLGLRECVVCILKVFFVCLQ